MNKHYKLLEIKDSVLGYISVSIDYYRLDDYIEDLEAELEKLHYKGSFALDFLLSNGLKGERYFHAYFDGKKILLSTIYHMDHVTLEVSSVASEFYKKSHNLISQSCIISKPQRFLIKKGFIKI